MRTLLGFMDRDFVIAEISKLFLLDGLKLFPSRTANFFQSVQRVKRNYSLIDNIGAIQSASLQISERSLRLLRDLACAPISSKCQLIYFALPSILWSEKLWARDSRCFLPLRLNDINRVLETSLIVVYSTMNSGDHSIPSRSKILTIVRARACVNAFTTNVSELYATVWLGAVLQEVDHRSSSRNSVVYSSRYLDHRYYVFRGVRK